MTDTPQEPTPTDIAAEMTALSDAVDDMPATPPEEIEARLATIKAAPDTREVLASADYVQACNRVIDKMIEHGLADLNDGVPADTVWVDCFNTFNVTCPPDSRTNRMHGIAAQAIMRLMLRERRDRENVNPDA